MDVSTVISRDCSWWCEGIRSCRCPSIPDVGTPAAEALDCPIEAMSSAARWRMMWWVLEEERC